MAVTYFGKNENGSNAQSPNGYTYSNDNSNIVYTCPGSGNQEVKEIGARIYNLSTGNIRLAIYDASLNFVCQGSAEIAVGPLVSGGTAWVSHTSFVDQGGSPMTPNLAGGTAYIIALTADSSSVDCWFDVVTDGYMKTESGTGEATGGYPASLDQGGNDTHSWCMRVGVEPASAGSIVPLFIQQRRQRI